MADKKPFEIARETLKQITARKLVPTPANYQSVYNEIAGIPAVGNFPGDVLRDIAQALPTKTPGQQKQKSLLEYAIDRMNWDGVKTALVAYGGFVPAVSDSETSSAAGRSVTVGSASAVPLTPEFLALIARILEYSQPALGQDDERFAVQLSELVASLKSSEVDVLQLKNQLLNFSHRLSFVAEDQAEIKSGLLKLLQLVFENIADIALDDQWLQGQMEALKQASAPPLSLRRLDDVERRLRDVIFKQKDAKDRAVQAQEEMRQMLATFIERLSELTQSTGIFQNKLEESARQIEQAKTLEEIAPVLREVVGTTRAMAAQSQGSQSELQQLQERAQKTEAELAKLHQELDRVSIQARHDSLTGALNRKGLEEAANREISQMRRKDSVLSVALLDIDNFKKLNDTLGHATGDMALSHLATVACECMRPQDTLARYGGEEFVILLPDTAVDNAVEAMTRLQRELTKRFFLSGTEKVLITFSAGVAQVALDEEPFEAIKRADKAMYLAKRAGKNRVLAA
ncbi:diguanylate cyclase [Curvibacter sp. CHRR-16]|uniref:GGDEF domain-containing protein n=1 Tax=Curvibacter sp. CHRR-16 TaxID=2835872 RepID=UPI001BDAD34C|nr:GGDEF domain-containing protein [Curvibacter sp. CHRR-16]MBT0570270.1 diguanylate cyclase [Curvibacter sp. CHRR-16]